MDDKIIHTLRKRFPTAKIMPDLLVEAQHSTVRIFEVKYAEDYEFEDWQSWGLGGYYSYSANLSYWVKWQTGECNVTGGAENLPQLSI